MGHLYYKEKILGNCNNIPSHLIAQEQFCSQQCREPALAKQNLQMLKVKHLLKYEKVQPLEYVINSFIIFPSWCMKIIFENAIAFYFTFFEGTTR